jgi:S1-C subfamily serine protease
MIIALTVTFASIAPAAFAPCGIQDPLRDPMPAVLASEAGRVAVIARCSPAVCSVMAMNEPGGGSGVIIDPAGFVLTNYHVVGEPDKGYAPPSPPAGLDEAEQAAWRDENLPRGQRHYRNKKVGLPDGQLYEGIVLGIDPGSDLALLRLVPKRDGQTWPWCALGNSDRLLVGETVFAMGNPFLLATDFTPTVTFGIVSGTHRYQEGAGNRMLVYPDCIQVDAPVNPGNSGGPLFNEAGEVIGINGRIQAWDRGRVNVGVGFAIASNQIANFLADMIAGRHTEHGTMDMSAWFMGSRHEDQQQQCRGVFVQQLFEDSVAATAGIGLGDEILRFDGTDVRSANQLATLIGVLPAGAWVTVAHRAVLANGGFGEARDVTLRLSALDTGSSFDGTGEEARLASRRDRRLATAALLARWSAGGADEPAADAAVSWSAVNPDGATHRAILAGNRLRLERGSLVLVRDGDRAGFARDGDKVRDLTAEESERLRREWTCNPMLWSRAVAKERMRDALLVGGAHVHGAPAYRFALPGEGECEAWFFADGAPAGCAFRDPLRRAKVERHVRGEQLRFVVDGKIEAGWTGSKRTSGAVDEAWFRRQP